MLGGGGGRGKRENQNQITICFGYFSNINQTIVFMTSYQEYSQTTRGSVTVLQEGHQFNILFITLEVKIINI